MDQLEKCREQSLSGYSIRGVFNSARAEQPARSDEDAFVKPEKGEGHAQQILSQAA
jgi:hypothetical protein